MTETAALDLQNLHTIVQDGLSLCNAASLLSASCNGVVGIARTPTSSVQSAKTCYSIVPQPVAMPQ